MPVCHRGQVVVDWALCGSECECYFGFPRGPFLATRQQVKTITNRIERGYFAREWPASGGRLAAVVANQRLEFLGVALFHGARAGQEFFQLVLLDVGDECCESNHTSALGFEQKVECFFQGRVHIANLVSVFQQCKLTTYL